MTHRIMKLELWTLINEPRAFYFWWCQLHKWWLIHDVMSATLLSQRQWHKNMTCDKTISIFDFIFEICTINLEYEHVDAVKYENVVISYCNIKKNWPEPTCVGISQLVLQSFKSFKFKSLAKLSLKNTHSVFSLLSLHYLISIPSMYLPQ